MFPLLTSDLPKVPEVVGALVEVLAQLSALTREAARGAEGVGFWWMGGSMG